MCTGQLLMGAGVGTYPALLPRIAEGWSWSAAEAGLVGGILFLGYVAATPYLSGLTDRVDARRVYAGSSVVAAAGMLLFALFAEGLMGALRAMAETG